MKLIYPEYYKAFVCIASDCEDSCCKEWEVDVDDASAAFYRQLPGALGNRLQQVLRQEDGCTLMTIENGRCPMWRQDGLCEIQAQHGHEALCETCRQYPRLKHEYGDFTEMDLELSCPEAARLIFSGSQATVTETVSAPADYQYDTEAMAILQRSRKDILDFWETSPYSLPQKLTVLLLYAHSVQSELDGGDPALLCPEQALANGHSLAQNGDIEAIVKFYVNLEILTPRWKARLDAPKYTQKWDPRLLRFITYGIRRYWLQAVSDYDLICRVKFLICSCLLLRALGGDPVSTAQLWSKEIENDPDNVEALLDGAYTSPAFTDLNLLSLLNE